MLDKEKSRSLEGVRDQEKIDCMHDTVLCQASREPGASDASDLTAHKRLCKYGVWGARNWVELE